MEKKGLFTLSLKNLIISALLVAVSVILTRYLSMFTPDNLVRVGFGQIPLIYIGMILGPVFGGLAGIVADLLGYVVNPTGGAFFFGFTLSSALTGILPGLVVLLVKKRNLTTVVLSNVLVYIVISLMLDTLWLNIMYGKAFFAILPARVMWHGAMTVLRTILLWMVVERTKAYHEIT